jgi:hypothetical protein
LDEEPAMPNTGTKQGQQPEALRSLKTAAEHGSKKPDDQGLTARGDTAPKPSSLKREQDTAAEVLEAGAQKDPRRMDKAAKKAPER